MQNPGGSQIPVVDLFAGPGGLGEGFAAVGESDGESIFHVSLSIEQEERAYQTLQLRHFFRRFPIEDAPPDYYMCLRGEIGHDELFSRFPEESKMATLEARQASLGNVPQEDVDQWVKSAIGQNRDRWILLGGPPCQAYSLMGRSRNRGNSDYRAEEDHRHFLYEQYLRIIASHWPPVFVMENVKGLLSATVSDTRIVHRILQELADPATATGSANGHQYRIHSLVVGSEFGEPDFDPSDLVIRAEKYGVPQARHRVILLGVREDLQASPSQLQEKHKASAGHVLRDLPGLRSGLSRQEDSEDLWMAALGSARQSKWLRHEVNGELKRRIETVLAQVSPPAADRGNEFIPHEPASAELEPDNWFVDERIRGVCNHTTRGHMVADLHRYLFAAVYAELRGESPGLGEFPDSLLPDHKSVARGHFKDRFRVQLRDRPATTVTSHISKDGHYYIHYEPTQCRSLTVREAARLQTFPDNYFFCGPRTAQYVQVGNAVPPYLSLQIGEVVRDLLAEARLL